MRGRAAWHMPVVDVRIGHHLGFDYPVDGDQRPCYPKNQQRERGNEKEI